MSILYAKNNINYTYIIYKNYRIHINSRLHNNHIREVVLRDRKTTKYCYERMNGKHKTELSREQKIKVAQ